MDKFALSPYDLRFLDESVEKDFRLNQRSTDAFFVRYLSLVTLIIEVMYSVKDFNWSPHLPEIVVYFRAFYLAPLMLLVFILTYVKQVRRSIKYLYFFSVLITLSLIFGQYFMTSANPDPESSFAKTLPLILVTTYLFTGLKFRHIIYLTPIILASFAYTMIYLREISEASKINDSILVVLNVILVIFFKYILEMSQRKIFIRSEVIRSNEETLRESLKAEKNLSTLRKDLLGILAHDIRSPLSNVKSIIQLASSGTLSIQDHQDLFNDLEEKIATIDNGVNDLLIWVKSKEEGMKVDQSAHYVKDLINETMLMYSQQIKDKKLRIDLNVDEGYEIITDAGILKTVLRNLLSNSIKYSHYDGDIQIKCISNGVHHKFEFIDHGVGMTDETIQKLSKEFHSTPGTSNEAGTGLGLQICFNLLERLGSKLYISSEPNKGTTVSFELLKNNTPAATD